MASSHPRPYHRDSIFGAGPRRPLDRNAVARFRYLVHGHMKAGKLAPKHAWVLEELASHLGRDGRCDPSHGRLARGAQVSVRTVIRALERGRGLGLVGWVRRLIRSAWRTEQTSNQYVLHPETELAAGLIPSSAPFNARPCRSVSNLESGLNANVAVATKTTQDVAWLDAQASRIAAKISEEKRLRRLGVVGVAH